MEVSARTKGKVLDDEKRCYNWGKTKPGIPVYPCLPKKLYNRCPLLSITHHGQSRACQYNQRTYPWLTDFTSYHIPQRNSHTAILGYLIIIIG